MSDMLDVPGGNPMTEGLAKAAKDAAELAALVLVGLQEVAQLRQRQLQARLEQDEQRADAQRAELRAHHARARETWAPALEPGFAQASSAEAAQAWIAAQPWAEHDRSAADAVQRAEARLTQLHPDLMASYRQAVRDNDAVVTIGGARLEPIEAMRDALREHSRGSWRALNDPAALATMSPADTLGAWNTARLCSVHDPAAVAAQEAAEDHLRELRPVAMAEYDRRVMTGQDQLTAMQAVAPDIQQQVWEAHPVADRSQNEGAAEAARTVGNEQRQVSVEDLDTPDLRSTRDVDEHTQGVQVGSRYEELADASTASAAKLASQAYPQPVHAALGTRQSAPAPSRPGGRQPTAGRRR